ncbi:hypothetical protein ACFFJT_07095 [Dyella flava]|uniref:Uncharacterized protein n=1 Tax=Dyella flava TaxID=1920170 RepID=A0ABS2K8I1_9GAMM|nr:hypothetical protein [Dyella flava]MBM7127355.1 hypothetical protein [Dyella flava]GLQ50952.1 hypothetical protein GCM10010872_24010 [Dyella flava]
MRVNEGEIRNRLKLLHVVFLMFAVVFGLFVIALLINSNPWASLRLPFFAALWTIHLVLAAALGVLAGKLGKGGASVGFAAFITSPILAPISYARVVWWAHKTLSNIAQGAKICDELGIDEFSKMRPTRDDRL